MKVIVSHDVDHISLWEHHRDLIIPKFLARMFLEYAEGVVSGKELVARLRVVASNRWHRIGELIAFDQQEQIPATFFLAVNQGAQLAYPLRAAHHWTGYILASGMDAGVHGISFDSQERIEREYHRFRQICPNQPFGIRMHYLRRDGHTLERLSRAGYLFDSSERSDTAPYKIGEMWEFPLHIMDGDLFEEGRKWVRKPLSHIRELTRRRIETLQGAGLPYLTLLFHDRYFDPGFSAWKEWYEWILTYCRESGFTFTSYREAIREMEQLPYSHQPLRP